VARRMRPDASVTAYTGKCGIGQGLSRADPAHRRGAGRAGRAVKLIQSVTGLTRSRRDVWCPVTPQNFNSQSRGWPVRPPRSAVSIGGPDARRPVDELQSARGVIMCEDRWQRTSHTATDRGKKFSMG